MDASPWRVRVDATVGKCCPALSFLLLAFILVGSAKIILVDLQQEQSPQELGQSLCCQ